MISQELFWTVAILVIFYVAGIFVLYLWTQKIKKEAKEKDLVAKHRMYELAILKEISDRTGYSLNIKKILDVISGSLHQFLEYSLVSYMLFEPRKILFKVDIEQPVPPSFVKDIKERMKESLSALLGRDLKDVEIEEVITGAIMVGGIFEEDLSPEKTVGSYFNIPLVIAGNVVGVLTVAHTKKGLYKEEEVSILYKIIAQASSAVARLEEVIASEQGKISAMIESMVEGVAMTDLDYRIVAANPVAREIVGGEKDKNLTIFDFIDKLKGAVDIKEKLEEAIGLDKVLTINDIILEKKYYQILVSPVKSNTGDTKGQVLGGVIIFHDVTHEKEAEKMRNDFTSMMVHELRSPLGNIKKIGELMQSSKVLEDRVSSQEYISMLYESSSSMLDLVNDLLDVAKLESGKFEVNKASVDLSNLAQDRIKFYETIANEYSIKLRFYWDKKLPEAIFADENRIRQVINNLLSNAFKFTPKDGEVSVLCFLHKKGVLFDDELDALKFPRVVAGDGSVLVLEDCIVVAVSDTGEGIAEENIVKLWNKFVQFASSARRKEGYKGTGLGLVVVKGIVEAHGGTVGLFSKVGKGSTFYFTLPL